MISDWKKIRELLEIKQIKNIQIFMNLLIPKLFDIINKEENFDTNQKRENFENKINTIINEIINDYKNLSEEYLKINQSNIDSNPYQKILTETIFNLPEKDYPYFKYFTVPTYPNLKDLQKIVDDKKNKNEKYPVLTNYLNVLNNKKIKLLEYLTKINEFEMYLINTYSYKISREDAKKKKLKDELNNIDEKIKDKIKKQCEDFIDCYNNEDILKLTTKYKCRKNMTERKIDNVDYLAYFLNDDGEIDYGMRIASIYQNFIDIQNEFLNNIYESIKIGKNNYYTKSIQKQIIIQNATKNEVISLNIDTDTYSSFYSIFSNYSNRDIFELDDKNNYQINYKKYRDINYDLNSIENTLAEILLTGKKKFITDEQIFITYENEGYHGKKSSLILNIIQKYPQQKLNINQNDELNIELQNSSDNIKEILNSFQLFMFTFVQLNLPLKKDFVFNDEFFTNQFPQFIEINPKCKQILNNVKLENLIDVYEIIEKKSFKEIIKNIEETYKIKLDKDLTEKIKNYFNNINKNNIKVIITKTILTDVVRQFISRFLCENRTEPTIENEKNSLLDYLPIKEEFWIKYYNKDINLDKITEEFENIKTVFDIKIENAFEFYNYLYEIRDEKKEDDIIENIQKIEKTGKKTESGTKKKKQNF